MDLRIRATNVAWRRRHNDQWLRPIGCENGDDFANACRTSEKSWPASIRVGIGMAKLASRARKSFSLGYVTEVGDRELHFLILAYRFDYAGSQWIFLRHCDLDAIEAVKQARHTQHLAVFSIQDEERNRIAMELHDSTAQHLIAIQFGLLALQARPDADADIRIRSEMEAALACVTQQVRSLNFMLQSPDIVEHGLGASLESLVAGFGMRSGLRAEFSDLRRSKKLASAIEVTLFKIAQEALTNVQRHAHADGVRVTLCNEARLVILEIEDNGIGVSEQVSRASGACLAGVGLAAMRKRVTALDGQLEIRRTQRGHSSGPNSSRVRAHATGVTAASGRSLWRTARDRPPS